MTIREIFREFVALKQASEDRLQRDVALAWHVEAFARQKQLPSLQAVLSRRGKGQQQSMAEHRAMLEFLSQQYGIPLRRVSHGT